MQAVVCSIGWAGDAKKQAVGRVTLVIGQALAINSQGQKRQLHKADEIFVGDSIETDSGAHVHLKFVDEGRISVRPESRLNIEAYHYDKNEPSNSEIRFYLHKGVLRSMSGKATEAAHDRYRMNTPIAALGVLGTDYVLRTSLEKTVAAVYSGAITLAPINNGCNYVGLGTCANATELTADMSDMYLEVSLGDVASQLKIQDNSIQYAQLNTPEQEDSEEMLELGGGQELNQVLGNEGGALYGNDRENALASNEKIAASSVSSDPVFSGLSWIRWSWQAQHADDSVSKDRSQRNENQNLVTGGSYAGLFRDTSALRSLQPRTGVFDFKLHNSHVVFMEKGTQWQHATAASLNKANLQLDFASREFNTQLEIFHQQTGIVNLNVSGKVTNSGLIQGNNATSNVKGAVTLDGANAGLQFDKALDNGSLQGITEWKR